MNFETTYQYQNEEGKTVKQTIGLMAVTFGDAEEQAMKYAEMIGNIEITKIARVKIAEVIRCESDIDRWFKAKLSIIEDEKKKSYTYVVNADSVEQATKMVKEFMQTSMCDWELERVTSTNIIDVL